MATEIIDHKTINSLTFRRVTRNVCHRVKNGKTKVRCPFQQGVQLIEVSVKESQLYRRFVEIILVTTSRQNL